MVGKTNPYETNGQAARSEKPIGVQSNWRIILLALVTLMGAGNTVTALMNAYRERYPTLDGYLFIGIATLIPYGVGAVGLLTQLARRSTMFWLWSMASIVALLPGLLLWSIYASFPTPRVHMGAGQMHIFFLPIIHIGYCFLVYLGAGLLALAISADGNK